MKQRLRPHRSVSLLHGIIRIAIVSRNNVIVAWTPVTVVFRSSVMSLIITFMFEPAKLQMNCASASGARNRRRAATAAAPGPRSGFGASVTSLRSRRGAEARSLPLAHPHPHRMRRPRAAGLCQATRQRDRERVGEVLRYVEKEN